MKINSLTEIIEPIGSAPNTSYLLFQITLPLTSVATITWLAAAFNSYFKVFMFTSGESNVVGLSTLNKLY